MQALLKAIKSLSDETRLRILNIFLVRECCACEVMQIINVTQTRASRNLNLLHDVGFLKVRRGGLWAYYSIDRSTLPDYLSLLFNTVELKLKFNEVASQDQEHLKEAKGLSP